MVAGQVEDLLSADLEHQRFKEYLADPTRDPGFDDDLHKRFVQACTSDPPGSPMDLAVLLRQALRRMDESQHLEVTGRPDFRIDGFNVAPSAFPHEWGAMRTAFRTAGVRDTPLASGLWRVSADPWSPDWLAADGRRVDLAAIGGTRAGFRRGARHMPTADPAFRDSTTYPTYSSDGQCAAVRSALTAAPGSFSILLLPTGSGKTEIPVTLAMQSPGMTTVLVVPTIALAIDFERRLKDVWHKVRGADPGLLRFAWTSDTPLQERSMMAGWVVAGSLPILVTSPEALAGGELREAVLEAASAGHLRALVIDEAHLVGTWGLDFRPEFRALAGLFNNLRSRAKNHEAVEPICLAMTGTLTGAALDDLVDLFSPDARPGLVAASELRKEHDLWVTPLVSTSLRQEHVMEAVAHLPRPLILYVTKPDAAAAWRGLLTEAGYSRVAEVTGRSAGDDRADVLEGWSTQPDPARFDMVVATSAFGLGIDNQHVRSVVHACMPENVERWYQEVGRAGRDGGAAIGLLVSAYGDQDEAASLGPRFLTPEKACNRWTRMWQERKHLGTDTYINLQSMRNPSTKGSMNRRWNSQIVRGLRDIGALQPGDFRTPPRDTLEALGVADLPREEAEYLHVAVTPLINHLGLWDELWEDYRGPLIQRHFEGLNRLGAVLRGQTPACHAIAETFAPIEENYTVFHDAAEGLRLGVPCGRCDGCRAKGEEPVPDGGRKAEIQFTWRGATELPAALTRIAALGNPVRVSATEDDVDSLVQILAEAGVQHFCGLPRSVIDMLPVDPERPLFLDDKPVPPEGLLPLPAAVYYGKATVPYEWQSFALMRTEGASGVKPPTFLIGEPGAFDASAVRSTAFVANYLKGADG